MLLIGAFNTIAQNTIVTSKGRLELIADELDISEEQAYQSLVKEQRIQAYRNLMIYLTMFIGLIGMKKSLKKLNNDKHDYERYGEKRERYKDTWIFVTILFSAIFVASIIYNSIMLGDTFTGLFNPEYGALEQLEFLNK